MDNLRKEFRFHATDNELLGYLREEEGFHRFPSCGRRLISSRSNRRAYLPHFLDKWFFISKRLQSHPLSCNTVKQLTGGYWKEAGKPQPLKKVGDTIISTKRTLKFTSNTEKIHWLEDWGVLHPTTNSDDCWSHYGGATVIGESATCWAAPAAKELHPEIAIIDEGVATGQVHPGIWGRNWTLEGMNSTSHVWNSACSGNSSTSRFDDQNKLQTLSMLGSVPNDESLEPEYRTPGVRFSFCQSKNSHWPSILRENSPYPCMRLHHIPYRDS